MEYAKEVEGHLKRLCEIDYYRKKYYIDLGNVIARYCEKTYVEHALFLE